MRGKDGVSAGRVFPSLGLGDCPERLTYREPAREPRRIVRPASAAAASMFRAREQLSRGRCWFDSCSGLFVPVLYFAAPLQERIASALAPLLVMVPALSRPRVRPTIPTDCSLGPERQAPSRKDIQISRQWDRLPVQSTPRMLSRYRASTTRAMALEVSSPASSSRSQVPALNSACSDVLYTKRYSMVSRCHDP